MHKILIDTTDRYKKSVSLEGSSPIQGDIDVVSSIAKVLKENNLKVSDIDEFECNPGPGSFTGIKVGVTITNVLNWVLGKKDMTELTVPNYGREPNITPRKKKN